MLETYYYISMPCRGETDPALELTEGVWAFCLRHRSDRNGQLKHQHQSSNSKFKTTEQTDSSLLLSCSPIIRKPSPERCSYNNPIHKPTQLPVCLTVKRCWIIAITQHSVSHTQPEQTQAVCSLSLGWMKKQHWRCELTNIQHEEWGVYIED